MYRTELGSGAWFHIRGQKDKLLDAIEMMGLKDDLKPHYERKNCKDFNENNNFVETQHLQGLSHYPLMETLGHIQIKCDENKREELIEIIEKKYKIVGTHKTFFLDERCDGLDKTKNMYCDVKNKYRIFVISYKRHNDKDGKTCCWLEKMGIPYTVVVEEDQQQEYQSWLDTKNGFGRVMCMPKLWKEYQNERGNFGSIPVRNFIHRWNIIQKKQKNKCDRKNKYWLLDDNIGGYKWVDLYTKVDCNSPLVFRMIEDWSDNIKNMYLCGHQYSSFVPEIDMKQKVLYGTRVFSSMLIDCNLPPLNEEDDIWRGKYNEDVDLSVRLLSQGFPTANFCNITSCKSSTGSCKGGNTDEIYSEDAGDKRGGKIKTDEIIKRWPEYVRECVRFGRPHHDIKNEWITKWKKNNLDYEEIVCEEYDIYYQ